MAVLYSSGLRFGRQWKSAEFEPSIAFTAKFFNDLGLGLKSYREPLTRAVRQVMVPSIEQNFISSGRPDPWEPLADYTVKRRQKDGFPGDGPILIRSKKLLKAATTIAIWDINPVQAGIRKFPTRVWYGALHQTGSTGSGLSGRAKKYQEAGFSASEARREALRDVEKLGSSSSGMRPLPARPFLVIQDEDIDDIRDVFDRWMQERINKANARTRGR